jgi:hypothetical protein
VLCSLGGEDKEEVSAWAYLGCFAQVPPGLHSIFRPATWAPFIVAMEPPSTSAGGPTSSSLPVAGCSTSSSTAGWCSFLVLQLWSDWALLS